MMAASSNSWGMSRKKFINRITFQIGSAPGRINAHKLLSKPRLRTTKNDRPGTAVLPASTKDKLAAFCISRPGGPLFLAGDRRICMRHAQRRLAGWLAKAKVIGKSAHALRHTFACRIYQQTGDLQITQQAMGHASIVSTCIYAKVDQARLRAAVGA